MTIGCKTGGTGEGVSYRGSHGQTVRVGRSDDVDLALKSGKCVAGPGAVSCVESSQQLIVRLMAG